MNKKQLFILALLFILPAILIITASALQESDADYLVKQYSVFDLKRTCINNNSWCSNIATCNITINYIQGDGLVIVKDAPMTNQGPFFNITLYPRNTSVAGWYQTYITCIDNGDKGSEFFYYLVTPTGNENSTTFFIIIGLVMSGIIVFGYAIRNEYVVFIGGMAAIVLGLYSMVYGFGQTANDFTHMLSVVIIGIGLIFTIQPAYSLIESNGETGYEEVLDIET